jgi:hypothetical protein
MILAYRNIVGGPYRVSQAVPYWDYKDPLPKQISGTHTSVSTNRGFGGILRYCFEVIKGNEVIRLLDIRFYCLIQMNG